MNRKVITFIAALMLILMVLSIFTDMWPGSGTEPESANSGVDTERVLEERIRSAEKLSEEQIADCFARMSGYQIGTALAHTFPGLRYEYVDTAALLRGLGDALGNSRGIDWDGRWSPLESNAAQVIWARNNGCKMPDLSQATAEEKAFYERVLRRADERRDTPAQAAADAAYSLGLNAWLIHYSTLPLAGPADLRAEALLDGLRSGLQGELLPEDDATMQSYAIATSWWIDARQRVAAEKNKREGEQWLRENERRDGVTTRPDGLQYRVLEPGSGSAYDPAAHGTAPACLVSYEVRKVDGSVMDSADESAPIALPLNEGIIPGLREALKLMPVGARWEVALPADLAYGQQAPALIGPDAVLIFLVKLHAIIPSEQMAAPAVGASSSPGASEPAGAGSASADESLPAPKGV